MLTQVQLLKKYKIRIRGHLGQHLLMDPNTIRRIADGLQLGPKEPVFEIGPGLGAMTVELLSRGHPVLAVEKDPKFVEVLNAEVAPYFPGKLTVVHGDILEADLAKLLCDSNQPRRMTGSTDEVKTGFKVIGNLPYYISTPILFHLIGHRVLFHSAVFTLQKEVAARMTAKAGDDDYGRLSVSAGVFGKTEALFDISPKCFLPAPEVTSRVVRYTFYKGLQLKDETFLLEVIRVAFSQRRKTLLSLFQKGLKIKRGREEHLDLFRKLGFKESIRGEELSTAQFIALAEALK